MSWSCWGPALATASKTWAQHHDPTPSLDVGMMHGIIPQRRRVPQARTGGSWRGSPTPLHHLCPGASTGTRSRQDEQFSPS